MVKISLSKISIIFQAELERFQPCPAEIEFTRRSTYFCWTHGNNFKWRRFDLLGGVCHASSSSVPRDSNINISTSCCGADWTNPQGRFKSGHGWHVPKHTRTLISTAFRTHISWVLYKNGDTHFLFSLSHTHTHTNTLECTQNAAHSSVLMFYWDKHPSEF